MTPQDMEIQALRREIARLRRELSEAKDLRMLDMAEIVRLRRMLEVAIDG